ncbi:glyoxalase superfamily protein [Paraburkholderia sediminicola]|uniref:glyoxalase superfamily protein n=1 Tax=Paraburkholderia sediminicola TaxID=458836 RepID=UPI0038B79E50
MKFYLVSIDVAKRRAKRLRKLVGDEQLRHQRALDITAYVYGYRNWNDLLTTFDHESPSPTDNSLAESDANARRRWQIDRLCECSGWQRELSERVVAEWRLTEFSLNPTNIEDGADPGSPSDVLDCSTTQTVPEPSRKSETVVTVRRRRRSVEHPGQ